MKLLVVGGLLTVGIVVVGLLTIGLMQEDVTEQAAVVPSTSGIVSQSDNQEQAEVVPSTSGIVSQSDNQAQAAVVPSTSGVVSLSDNQAQAAVVPSTSGVVSLSDNQAQAAVAPSTSDVVPLSDNQEQPVTSAQKTINDLVLQDTPVNTSTLNVIDNAIVSVSLYGNKDQPGTRVHQAINDLVLQGNPVKASILKVIDNAITNEGANLLSSAALKSTRNNKPTVLALMANMVAANDLFPATKLSIENKPEDVLNIINAGVVLYPDFAQVVINAAVMSGEIDSEQALLAALSAGADPTTVGEATAAGGPVALALAAPVGVGIGAGGTGGGDLTASTN